MGARRKAREYALQMLFESDVGRNAVDEIQKNFWAGRSESSGVRQFANSLFAGTVSRRDQIDELIQRQAENWRLERMAVVDRNVLRLAVYECMLQETPKAVVINEAIEIARKFSSDEATEFINGVLDGISKQMEGSG